ncbi:phosphopantetheine-binding protein [Actinokineospora sp.]|uniref:phosphopantetheine-binding protein n=1 Tax=Actinokineospora sp. TaxID=1872133 RepID=UPI0040383EA5
MIENQLRELFAATFAVDIPAADILVDEPLWGSASRFGLDSMDSLKLIALVQQRHGFDIGALTPTTFTSVRSIVEFIDPAAVPAN